MVKDLVCSEPNGYVSWDGCAEYTANIPIQCDEMKPILKFYTYRMQTTRLSFDYSYGAKEM